MARTKQIIKEKKFIPKEYTDDDGITWIERSPGSYIMKTNTEDNEFKKTCIEDINKLKNTKLIYLLLKYLKENNNNFTSSDFNKIAVDNNFKTRFTGNGRGKCALTNKSKCWLEKYQNKFGPIIINDEGENYKLTNIWKNILDNTSL